MAAPGWYRDPQTTQIENGVRFWSGTEWIGATVDTVPESSGGYAMIPPEESVTAAAYGREVGTKELAQMYRSSPSVDANRHVGAALLYWLLVVAAIGVVAAFAWRPVLEALTSVASDGQSVWDRTNIPPLGYGLGAAGVLSVAYLVSRNVDGRHFRRR